MSIRKLGSSDNTPVHFSTDETVENLRALIKALAKHHGVDEKRLKMTRNPYLNFHIFRALQNNNKRKISVVASETGKIWKKMSIQEKEPYRIMANIVKKTKITH